MFLKKEKYFNLIDRCDLDKNFKRSFLSKEDAEIYMTSFLGVKVRFNNDGEGEGEYFLRAFYSGGIFPLSDGGDYVILGNYYKVSFGFRFYTRYTIVCK